MHKTAQASIFLSTLFLFAANLPAQQPALRFDHLTMEQGLSESIVLSIIQDHRGYMWFGTADGLNRYDGYSFTVFKHNPDDSTSLTHNYVQVLHEDHTGRLWVGTLRGLDWFDPETERFHHYELLRREHQNQNELVVSSIRENPQGTLWVGAGENVFKLSIHPHLKDPDAQPTQLARYRADRASMDGLHGNFFGGFEFDREGRLWISSLEDGANILDTATGIFTHLRHDSRNPRSISSSRVSGLLLDSTRRFWIATENAGINRVDEKDGTFIHYRTEAGGFRRITHNTIRRQFQDRKRRIWVATDGGGLLLYDPTTDGFHAYLHDPSLPTSIASDRVISVYEDRAGTLWFGTWGAGVDRWSPSKEKFVNDEESAQLLRAMKNRFVISFFQDSRGRTWVGTHGGGAFTFDPATKTVEHLAYTPGSTRGLSNGAVWCIQEDRNGLMWFATDQGVNGYDPKTKEFIHFDDRATPWGRLSSHYVGKVTPDSNNVIWVATEKGVDKIDMSRRSISNFGYSLAGVDSSQGYVAGLLKVGPIIYLSTTPIVAFDTKQERYIPTTLSVGDRPVSCIAGDLAGNIWVGTFGDGVFQFDSSKQLIAHLTERDGLPNNVVYGVVEDHRGNYWMSTNKGITRYNSASRTFRNYDIADGLQSNEFNRCAFMKTRDGKLYFGGVNGFNSFFPDSIADNPYVPPIVATTFRKFDEPVSFDVPLQFIHEITLSHQENFFSFEFAALDFTDPVKNRYMYMLEGFDQRWVDAGTRRFARYTNVGPGEYTFHVRGSNNDGVWNLDGTSIRVSIPPPFWKTGWFITAMVILGAGTFGGVVRSISIRKLKARLKELEYQQKLQQERERISRDLHDNVGAQLVSIISGLDLVGRYAPSADARSQRILRSLQDDARSSISQLRETIWALKSSSTTVQHFAEHMEAYARRQLEFHEQLSLRISVSADSTLRLTPIQSLTCFRILQEALTNTIKHACAKSIEITFASPSPEVLEITVSDDGRGISPDAISGAAGNGLLNMRTRISELSGSISIGRSERGGTEVRFRFHISNTKIPSLGD